MEPNQPFQALATNENLYQIQTHAGGNNGHTYVVENKTSDDLLSYLPNTTIETQNSTDYTSGDEFNEFIDLYDIDIDKDLFDSSQQGEQNHNSKSFLFFSIFTNIQYSS